jgi:hypothetical protein
VTGRLRATAIVLTVKQHWHERFHHDEGNRWLRRVISRLLSGTP